MDKINKYKVMESWRVLVSKITISKQKIIMMKRRKKLDLSLALIK